MEQVVYTLEQIELAFFNYEGSYDSTVEQYEKKREDWSFFKKFLDNTDVDVGKETTQSK